MARSNTDLVEEQLTRRTDTAALDIAEEVADDSLVVLCNPVENRRIGEIGDGVMACDRGSRCAAPGHVEIVIVSGQQGQDALIARTQQSDGERHLSTIREPILTASGRLSRMGECSQMDPDGCMRRRGLG
jgi:hypothetical protein